jgi:protein-S-isoprenylcysteine O-methyltransferase Ste14
LRNKQSASNPTKSGLAAYILVSLSFVFGAGSLIIFTVFLYVGSFHIIELGLGTTQSLVFNTCLCLVFFLQHSGMIRTRTQRWMSQFIPEYYLGAVFSIVSALLLLILVMLWQESMVVLASAEGIYRLTLRALFFFSIAVQIWGILSLKSADLFGTKALLRNQSATQLPSPIVIGGPYRWVRHPLYLTILLMIWSHPDLTADRLLFNVLFSVWIIAGTVLEERDLVGVYGDEYRKYQLSVPMLIPYRKPGAESK